MKTSFFVTSLALLLVAAAYGCGDDSGDDPDDGNPRAGSAGARPSGGKGGAAGAGGRTNGGAATAGAGGRTSDDGGAAGAAGSSGAPDSSAGAAGSSGAGGSSTEGGGSATQGGAGGDGDHGGAGGAAAHDDPRCAEVSVDETLTSHLRITADNECDVYVNGELVGSTANWSSAVTIDVSLFVHPGRKNVVAVVGRNTSSQAGNDRGIIGELTTTVGETTTPVVVTDASWRVAQEPEGEWTRLDYDDSTWAAAAEIADASAPPWNGPLGTTDARWIWSAPVPASTAEKPNEDAAYARRVFYFDFEGAPANEPSCSNPKP